MSDALTLTVRIKHDDDPTSPREDRTNLGTLVTWHNRYTLGDERPPECPEDPGDFAAWAEAEDAVWLPVYLYDHSGLALSTTPFSCPWDSGQVGYIYATPDDMRACYGGPLGGGSVGDGDRRKAEEDLRGQVVELNQFLAGDIYGYIIEDEDGDMLDSVWGYYGQDEAQRAAYEALSSFLEPERKEVPSGA